MYDAYTSVLARVARFAHDVITSVGRESHRNGCIEALHGFVTATPGVARRLIRKTDAAVVFHLVRRGVLTKT